MSYMPPEAMSTWGLMDRFRYRSKHRAQDLELIQQHWPLSHSEAAGGDRNHRKLMHIDDAPAPVKRKWTRAVRMNKLDWMRSLRKPIKALQRVQEPSPDMHEQSVEFSTELIESMKEKLPRMKGKILIDVRDEDIRGIDENGRPRKDLRIHPNFSVTMCMFYALYRRGQTSMKMGKFKAALVDFHEALLILPAIQHFPSPVEVNLRKIRGGALHQMGSYDQALVDWRVSAAACRLLMYHGVVDQNDPQDYQFEMCTSLPMDIVMLTIDIKLRNKTPRPLFSPEERNSLFKELGVGPYSIDNYKCSFCKKSRHETRLLFCSGCDMTWFCSQECQRKGWKEHKKICGSKKCITLERTFYHEVRNELNQSEDIPRCKHFLQKTDMSVLCYDAETDEIYDAFTNVTATCDELKDASG